MFLEKKRRQQKSRKLHTKLEIKKIMTKTFRSRFKFVKKWKIIKMQDFDSISQKFWVIHINSQRLRNIFLNQEKKKLIDRLSEIFIRTRIVQF